MQDDIERLKHRLLDPIASRAPLVKWRLLLTSTANLQISDAATSCRTMTRPAAAPSEYAYTRPYCYSHLKK